MNWPSGLSFGPVSTRAQNPVRKRDQQPPRPRRQFDDREHDHSAGHESRRHLVDGIREREQPSGHVPKGTV